MSESEVALPAEYQATYDHDVFVASERAMMRKNWRGWLNSCLQNGAKQLIVAFAISLMVSSFVGTASYSILVILSAILGFVVGFLWVAVIWLDAYRDPLTSDREEVWTCRITDEGWSYQRTNGHLTLVPWKLMSIHMTLPDACIVYCGNSCLTIFRQPLRDAGPEATFLSKIPKTFEDS